VFQSSVKMLTDTLLKVPELMDEAISQLPGADSVSSPLQNLGTTSESFLRLLGAIMTSVGLIILVVISVMKEAMEAKWR
jgi:hypothetical protein